MHPGHPSGGPETPLTGDGSHWEPGFLLPHSATWWPPVVTTLKLAGDLGCWPSSWGRRPGIRIPTAFHTTQVPEPTRPPEIRTSRGEARSPGVLTRWPAVSSVSRAASGLEGLKCFAAWLSALLPVVLAREPCQPPSPAKPAPGWPRGRGVMGLTDGLQPETQIRP